MRIVRTLVAGAVALIATAITAAAIGSAAPAPTPSNELWLRGAGATFPAPLYKKWIADFHAQNPDISIAYDAVGSGEGIRRFTTGSVDFGGSDVPLSQSEAARVPGGAVMVPGTAGMIVLAYNLPKLGGPLKLPRDVFADIFSGKIANWSDPRIQVANPDLKLPRLNIVIVARLDSSGTTYNFTSHLAAISADWRKPDRHPGKLVEWPGTAMLAAGNEGVASRIDISQGAIGYVEYGFAKRLGLPMAILQNKAGTYVRPTEEAGQAGLSEATAKGANSLIVTVTDPEAADAYPIVAYSWLLLYADYKDARKGDAVTKFLNWGLTEGQSAGNEFGYIPLPPAVAAQGLQAVASVRH
jgi:phosphate transport system substrate-binding protein